MTNQNQTPSSPPPPAQTRSGSSTILIVVIVVVLLAALGLFLVLIFGGDGSDTAGSPPEASAPPEITMPTPEPGTPMLTTLADVNVRAGPGTNFPSYGIAPEGSQGPVVGISEDGGWWVVQVSRTDLVPDGQGWVSGEYVITENTEGVPVIPSPEPPPVVEVPPPDPNAPKATALDAVQVRSGPGTNYASYGVAPKGAQGEVVGISEDGGWWVVKLSTSVAASGQGWVSADWVWVENGQGVPVIPAP